MKADLYTELFGLVTLLDDRNEATTLGSTHSLDEEPVRFHNISQLSFPGPPNSRFDDDAGQTRVDTAIFGLLGPIGPLPYVYSEMEARATRGNDPAMRDLLDIFSHRAASLMYRAWRKNRNWLEYQPGAARDRQRKFSAMLEGFAGVTDLPGRIAWLEVERKRVLSCMDVFPRRVRSAGGLRRLLNRQFNMRFEIEEFVGAWETLPIEARSSLGSGGVKPQLGYTTIIGSRSWQAQSTFQVVIRHPSAAEYRALQPGSESLRLMQLVIALYCPPELAFRIHIVVSADAIEPGALGTAGQPGAMLGWNTVAGVPRSGQDYALSICRNYNESRMNA